MRIFVANFTSYKIDEQKMARFVKAYLAKQKNPRIINLNVVFLSAKRIQLLNRRFAGKNYIPDVLTFPQPLNEILICPEQAARNGQSINDLLRHGLDHLLGKHH